MVILCIRLKNTISKYLRFRPLQPRFDCQKPSNSEVRSNFLSASVATAYSLFQYTFSKVVKSKIRKPSHMALFIPSNATEEVSNKTTVNCKELPLNFWRKRKPNNNDNKNLLVTGLNSKPSVWVLQNWKKWSMWPKAKLREKISAAQSSSTLQST